MAAVLGIQNMIPPAAVVEFTFTRRPDTIPSAAGVGCGSQNASHRPKHASEDFRASHTYCVQFGFAAHLAWHSSSLGK